MRKIYSCLHGFFSVHLMNTVSTHTFLNKHLSTDTNNGNEITPMPEDVYSAVRNPMVFLTSSNITINIFRKKWKFSDKMFEQHDIFFANMKPSYSIVHNSEPSAIDGRSPGGYTFYHFMMETLPSVLFLKKHDTLPIFCKPSNWAIPHLRWFGIQNTVLFDTPSIDSNLIHPTYIDIGIPSPEMIGLIRQVVESKLSFNPSIGILIKRRESRDIINHDETLDMLKRKYSTIEWHVFDNSSSVEDTALLFSRACIVAGPHGAGFCNTVFSPEGTIVLEFVVKTDPNACFWHLSEMLRNDHYMIPTTTDDSSNFMVNVNNVYPVLPDLKNI